MALFFALKEIFTKPHLSYEEQVGLLKSRGMVFENEENAAKILQTVSYYRLSGYWFHLQNDDNKFSKQAKFEDIFRAYKLDEEMRSLIFPIISLFEVSLRSKIGHIFGEELDQTFLFNQTYLKKEFLNKVSNDFLRSSEGFAQEIHSKYYLESLPAWIILETTSFGTLINIFKHIKHKDKAEDLNINRFKLKIAKSYNIESINSFISILQHLNTVRNICAHHSRTYNKNLNKSYKTINAPHFNKYFASDENKKRKIYNSFVALYFLLKNLKIADNELKALGSFFVRNNEFNDGFGIPQSFIDEPFCSRS